MILQTCTHLGGRANFSKLCWALGLSIVVMAHQTSVAVADDLSFHIEVIEQQDEVAPTQSSHVARHEAYYYAREDGVYVEDDRLEVDNILVPFDTPSDRTSRYGTNLTNTFHRIEGGIEAISEYEDFIVDRRIVKVDEKTCFASITATLKPGHELMALRRQSNHELIYLSALTYLNIKCEIPNIVG